MIPKLPDIFYNRWFLACLMIAFLISAGLEYNQYSKRRQIDSEIESLKQQEKELNGSNQQLEQSINFLSSPEYQDKLARLQLNLKKEGEIVVNFSEQQTASNQQEVNNYSAKSNLIKWWEYIFIN